MPDQYDIFLSYPSVDRAPATALKAALEASGMSVWMDTERIDDATSIQHSIETGLACSKVLVAWYSKAYAQSRACQWELTAGLIVSQTEQRAAKRVLVVNPETGVAHIAQTMVRDIELIQCNDGTVIAAIAQKLLAVSAQVRGLLGDIRQLGRPPWHGKRKGLGSSRFVGRLEELWRLQNALTSGRYAIVSGKSTPSAAIGLANVRGSGGMGKSLLVEEYALRFGAFWPGGIFWLDALGVSDRPEEAPEALISRRASYQQEQLSVFAEALGIDSRGLHPKQVLARIGLHLQQSSGPYLWLVDDLPACDRTTLDDWLAPSSNGVTLITSRARQHDALGTQVELGILQPDDAYALLCRERSPRNASEEIAARSIVQRLGGHAMAVDQARAACAVQGFTGFLQRLDVDDQRALALSRELAGELPNGHERDIAKTFLSSIDRLTPEGLDLLILVAQLSNAPISRNLIASCKLTRHLFEIEHFDLADLEARHKANLAAQDWADLSMQQLASLSLADFIDAESSEPGVPPTHAIAVHTLVARVARWHLAGDEKYVQGTTAWHKSTSVALLQVLRTSQNIRRNNVLLHEVPHARHLCEKVDTVNQAILLAAIADHDRTQGYYAQAKDALLIALKHFERVLGPEHSSTLSCMNSLALSHTTMGNLAAAQALQEQILAICQRMLGHEHPDTLICMNNLAVTLSDMGNLLAALTMQKQVLEINQRILGTEHSTTLTILGNIAETLRTAGELQTARTTQERVLAIRQRLLGDDHPDTLNCLNNLAETVRTMGDLQTARAMHEKVLGMRQRVLGSEHPDTLSTMHNLTSTLYAIGDLPAARTLQEFVLLSRQRVLGVEHPDTLTSMHNLAVTLGSLGHTSDSRAMQEQVLTIRHRTLGPEHPGTVIALGNLLSTLNGAKENAAFNKFASQYPAALAKLAAQQASEKNRLVG